MARLSFRCDEELVRRVDVERGLIPREAWLRRAVERALSEAKEPSTGEQADPGFVSSSEGVRSAAPAEQPSVAEMEAKCDRLASEYEERARYRQHVPGPSLARSSVQAKRDVRPIPKKGEK